MSVGVLAKQTARGDVLIRRGVTEQWAVRWERDSGWGYEPVDMSAYDSTVMLLSLTGDVWLTKVAPGSVNGVVVATITPTDLADPVWAGRPTGMWRIDAADADGAVERVGEGYFYLEA